MPRFQVNSGPISIANTGVTKTLVDLTTGGVGAGVAKWWVASDATSAGTATSAIRVQVGLFSAAVTTHTAYTPDPWDYGVQGVGATTAAGVNTTNEGAGTPTHIEEHVLGLTQSELIVWEPANRIITTSSFWRIRVIVPTGIGTTNLYAGVAWDE